jgi:hypothetical protein
MSLVDHFLCNDYLNGFRNFSNYARLEKMRGRSKENIRLKKFWERYPGHKFLEDWAGREFSMTDEDVEKIVKLNCLIDEANVLFSERSIDYSALEKLRVKAYGVVGKEMNV